MIDTGESYVRIAIWHNLRSGGAKRTLHEMVKHLSQGHSVDEYALSTADHCYCDLRPWVRARHVFPFEPHYLFRSPFGRLNQLQRWRDLRRLDQLARQIASQIDAEDYDVVFAQPCIWTQAPLVLRYLQTPSVYYLHEPPRALYEEPPRREGAGDGWRRVLDRFDPMIPLYRSAARRLDRKATQAANRVLVNSQFIREAASRIYGVTAHVCYHGIDTEMFRPLASVDKRNYVLSVGAIQPKKGFDFLIESLACLPQDRRPPLKLVGNAEFGTERQYLQNLAAKCGVELSIEVRVDDQTLVRRYNEATLFVYAPHNEPFGLAPLEAMACGTPVVGVAEGGVCETVLDGLTGYLVSRDRHAFADAVSVMLADPDRRWRFGQQGLSYVRDNWTWMAAVRRVEQHLCAVASQSCC